MTINISCKDARGRIGWRWGFMAEATLFFFQIIVNWEDKGLKLTLNDFERPVINLANVLPIRFSNISLRLSNIYPVRFT